MTSAATTTRQRGASRQTPARNARGGRGGRAAGIERSILGVPERFMRPRLVLIAVVAVLVGFGLLMIYSASSVSALNNSITDVDTGGDAAYFLKRQAFFAAIGVAAAVSLALLDYRLWTGRFLTVLWVVSVVLLIMVRVAPSGSDAKGATRWLTILGFRLQPSEFVKITLILTFANLADRCFERGTLSWEDFLKWTAGGVGVPLLLILLQPDKGSTLVIGATILVMAYLAGVPPRMVLGLFVICVVVFAAWSLRDSYSAARFLIMFDPWSDQWGTGYQLIQGWYAFGSGGLLGTGIGYSRQKYSYLPESYNDFIFAVIGEELGFVGTVLVLVLFALLVWAGLEIAKHAPDLAGRMVAAGSTVMLAVQLILNVCGVLGMFPLSGKPIPFLSYGGSSIIASLMLVGLIVSVSVHSVLPETAADRARRSLVVDEPEVAGGGFELVGEARPRSERGTRTSSATSAPAEREVHESFRIVDGGSSRGRVSSGERASSGARTSTSGRRERIDLGPSATERLRGKR